MKNLKRFGLLLTVFLLSLTSCNKDDNTQKSEKELILGTWKKVKMTSVNSSGETVVENYSQCKQKGTTTFKEDGKYKDIPYVEVSGNCFVDGITEGNYSVTGNKLLINNKTAEVFEVSETNLKIGVEKEYLEYTKSN